MALEPNLINDFNVLGLEERTSQQRLSELLKISRPTIGKYHQLALNHLEEYLADFPQIGGDYYTKIGLSPYQCWVIWRLLIASLKITYKVVEAKLEAAQEKELRYFSKEVFEQENQLNLVA